MDVAVLHFSVKCGKSFRGNTCGCRNIKRHVTGCTLVTDVHQEKGVKSDDEESRDYPRVYADQDTIDDDELGHKSVGSWCATDFFHKHRRSPLS